jgi:hypothetical protein
LIIDLKRKNFSEDKYSHSYPSLEIFKKGKMTIICVITLRNKSGWVKYVTIIQVGIQVRIVAIYGF